MQWENTMLPFHKDKAGRDVFELTQQAGGENETGYQWLLANVTLPTGDALEMTSGKVWNDAESTTDGKAGKAGIHGYAGKSSRDGRGGTAGNNLVEI